jgi:ABC-type antimicrobial peptide transport system permease subunit
VVIAYGVAQRTPEIGLRIALGAAGTDVVRLLMRQGIIVTAAGVAIGSAAARAFAAVLASALYGVTPNDPATFAAVAVALSAIGLTACYLPARRAIRVDPLIALKAE